MKNFILVSVWTMERLMSLKLINEWKYDRLHTQKLWWSYKPILGDSISGSNAGGFTVCIHKTEKKKYNNQTHKAWLTYTYCEHSANRQKSHRRQTESKTHTRVSYESNRENCAHVCAMPKTRLLFNSAFRATTNDVGSFYSVLVLCVNLVV